jgi:hypothetical protein
MDRGRVLLHRSRHLHHPPPLPRALCERRTASQWRLLPVQCHGIGSLLLHKSDKTRPSPQKTQRDRSLKCRDVPGRTSKTPHLALARRTIAFSRPYRQQEPLVELTHPNPYQPRTRSDPVAAPSSAHSHCAEHLSHPLFSDESEAGIQIDPQSNFPSFSCRNRPHTPVAVSPTAIICIPYPRNKQLSSSIPFVLSQEPDRPTRMGTRSLATARNALLFPKTARSSRTIPSYTRRRAQCTACRGPGAAQQRMAGGSNVGPRQPNLSRPTSRIIFPATFTTGARRRASVSSATVDGRRRKQAGFEDSFG